LEKKIIPEGKEYLSTAAKKQRDWKKYTGNKMERNNRYMNGEFPND
jgi:hypothetical protein